MALLSPVSLMMLCWGLTGAVTALTLARLDQMELVQLFMAREGLHLDAFAMPGLAWLLLGGAIYVLADGATRLCLPERGSFRRPLQPT